MKFKKHILALAITGLASSPVLATNGYFAYGYGTKSKGMGGAGSAMALDSMDAASNPATMVEVGNRMDVGVSLFAPRRNYTANTPTGSTGFGGGVGLANGNGTKVESDNELFLIPHFGYNTMLDANSSVGITVFGNGGMTTDYQPGDTPGGNGTYGSAASPTGATGVTMMQLFIEPTYSRKLSDTASYGISAIIGYQMFEAFGLDNYAGLSTDSSNMFGGEFDSAWGLGARFGIQGEVSPGVTLAASYQTKIYMEEFDKYKGLFAEQGDFDVPANLTLGLAWDVNKDTTLAFDIQRIFYSDVAAISNPISPNITNCMGGNTAYCLGGDQGIGFGWDDMTVFKLGVEWKTDPQWTWRAGISHADAPFGGSEVIFNIIAPAVVEDHITFGFTRDMGDGGEINFSAAYALENDVTGNPTGEQQISLEMDQFEFEISYGLKW
ncbi:MAG: outer membrane protein transport protein [Sedimenticola sp.]